MLAWRLSNTIDVDFCVEALEEALSKGKPEIFNTDQGSRFTSEAFTGILLDQGIQVSMDGKGRYLDNIFVERLWRSVKYEEVYLKAYQNGTEARRASALIWTSTTGSVPIKPWVTARLERRSKKNSKGWVYMSKKQYCYPASRPCLW